MQKDCLGDYEIIKQINKNALVTTYLARHRFIKKHFILKKLCQSLTKQDSFVERFEKIVPQLSLLNHINLCQIHTISSDGDTYFLVYENFYEKHPSALVLGDFLKNCSQRLELSVIEGLIQQVCSVCEYVHSHRLQQGKMFHGAICLDTLYVAKNSENSYHIILSDLGLFHLLGSSNLVLQSFASTLSCLSQDIGKQNLCGFDQITVKEDEKVSISKMHLNFLNLYAFLSPEQKKETFEKVNFKTDVYQVGVLAYYLFMGHFPSAYFPWACSNFSFDVIHWDLFLQRCLEMFATKRVASLSKLIDECKKKELGEIQDGLKKFIKPKIEQSLDEPALEPYDPTLHDSHDPQAHHDSIEKSLIHGTSPDQGVFQEPNSEPSKASRLHALEKSLMQGVSQKVKVSQIAVKTGNTCQTSVLNQDQEGVSLSRMQQQTSGLQQADRAVEASSFVQSNETITKAPVPDQSSDMKKSVDDQAGLYQKSVASQSIKAKGAYLATTQNEPKLVSTTSGLKPKINPSEVRRHAYEKDPGAIFKKPLQVSTYTPKVEENRQIEPIFNEMIVVSSGDYFRGCDQGARDEKPRHRIHVDDFAIDIHPVTNEQFILFLQVMASEKDGNNNDTISLKDSRIKKSNGQYSIETGYAKHPVVGVSWYGAKAYAQWIGKRLPTEAEWEVAAKGGSDNALYISGADIERTCANFFSSDSTSVMSYPPNHYGLYDVSGNVYEWVEDWYSYNYYESSQSEPDNPTGPLQGVYRVLRGGCWKSLKDDLRLSHRHRNNPKTMNSTCGFRLAADAQKES